MQRTPTTYSYQEIEQWKLDVRDLPNKIKQCELKIRAAKDEIFKLEQKKQEIIINDLNPQMQRTKAIAAKLATLQNPLTISHNQEQIRQFEAALSSQRTAQLELERRKQTLEATILNHERAEEIARRQAANRQSFANIEASRRKQQSLIHNNLATAANCNLQRAELKAALERLANISHTQHVQSSYSSTQSGPSTYTSSSATLQEASLLNQKIQELNASIQKAERMMADNRNHHEATAYQIQIEEGNIQANVTAMAKLEGELTTARFIIPEKPSDITHNLKRDRATLSDLQSKLTSLNREIKNNSAQQLSLQNESEQLAIEERKAHLFLHEFNTTNPNGELQQALSSEKYTQVNLDLLKAFSNEENKILQKHRATIQSVNDNIDQQNEIIRTESKIKHDHERKLQARHANQFLSDLNSTDSDGVAKLKRLSNNLDEELSKALTQYADNHARIEDPMVRARLREYISRTAFIMQADRLPETLENLQKRLVQLSGYIWSMQDNVTDKTFLFTLCNVLEGRAIAKQDALREFQLLRDQCPAQLFALTPENLQALEAQEYSDAYNQLNTLLNHQPADLPYYARQLFVTGKNLLNVVNDNNSSYSHSTQILTAARALILDFKSPQNHQKLANLLAENHHGKRSTAKVVAGAIVMLLAAASLAVFVSLGFLSLGILSVPVALGMTCSAVAFGAGLALCINGRNKGVHKAIMNLQWAADKSNEKYAESPLSRHSYFNPPQGMQPEASAPPLYVK